MIQRRFYINNKEYNVFAEPGTMLATVLREQLGLTGTKVGCGAGQCGACSVILDGKVVRSCITKISRVEDGARVVTIEGIGQPCCMSAVQKAWVKFGGAQCGFCSPGFIVSATALLTENKKPSREDVREWFQKNKNVCRCTGYKPLVDAVMEAAKVIRGEIPESDLDFQMPADGRIWGSKYPRPTAVDKVCGVLDYGADTALKMPPNTLRLALVQAEVSHAKIKKIDTAEAEKMPGVVKVLTHKDVVGKNRITGLITFPTNIGDGWDRPILCDEKVFQYGDAIAIVCADSVEQAKAAAEKVKVDYEVLPAYMNLVDAKAPDAIEIHPGTPNHYFTQKLVKGADTAPIMNNADVVMVEDFSISSRQPHLPIEPDCGFAYFDEEDNLRIFSKSIGIHLHQAMVVAGIGYPAEKTFLACNPMGGTFGYKFSPTMEALLGVAAVATKRPVSLVYDYKQQQQYTGKRSPFYTTIRLAADKKTGKLMAMETDFDVDHGPYSEFGDLLTLRGIQFMGAGYSIPNIRGEGRTICTNHAWGSAFRGYGGPQASLATELAMDKLAAKLGMDPLELRYVNALRPGDVNVNGQTPDSFSLPAMIDALRPKYKAALEKAKKESTAKHKKGVGISIGVYGCGLDGADGSEAFVQMNKDGSFTIGSSWEDHGQGADAGAIGVAHEALRPMGVKPEQLKFTWPDMFYTPNSGPAGGSRSQVMTGGAIRVACENMLKEIAKPGGGYYTYQELVDAKKPTRFDGKYSVPGVPNDENGIGKPFMVYMWGIGMAEVTVEVETGKVKMDKMTMHADVGKINNRLVVEGQNYGGLVQGLGLGLTEDFEDIKKHATMAGAGIPYIKDVPDDIEIEYFEEPREYGPFGSAGTGELPLCTMHPAIVNAIHNATGAWVNRIPALPERVLEALKAAK